MIDYSRNVVFLKKLAGALDHAAKAMTQGKPDTEKILGEATKLAEQFDWPGFVEGLKRDCEDGRRQHEASLQSRREKLLRAARDAEEPFEDGTRAVRVGVFRVGFEGESAVVSLAGVEVERKKEVDGEKLFKCLKDLRTSLEQSPFNREAFFKQLQASYATCRRDGTVDEFIPIRDLHRELLLERARTHEAFRKRPEPKNVPDYALHQFVFDLARFIQKGTGIGDDRLVTTTPSMRDGPNTVFIPNLDHPLGSETPAARLAIKRNQ